MDFNQDIANFRRMEKTIHFLEANFKLAPSLEAIAASAGLSKFHFQRLFKQFAGVTPVQFLQFLTLDYAKTRLEKSESVLQTALESGLSGGSRLHDLFVTMEAVTPGEFANQGLGITISYDVQSTPFGKAFLALTSRGICALHFLTENDNLKTLLNNLKIQWPKAKFERNFQQTKDVIRKIFANSHSEKKLTLLVRGTNLQIKVWQALLKIPEGHLVSYADISKFVGKPFATRSVASAIAKNPIAYLIPCHRVISKTGVLNNYRWGSCRKKILIGFEAAKNSRCHLEEKELKMPK